MQKSWNRKETIEKSGSESVEMVWEQGENGKYHIATRLLIAELSGGRAPDRLRLN